MFYKKVTVPGSAVGGLHDAETGLRATVEVLLTKLFSFTAVDPPSDEL